MKIISKDLRDGEKLPERHVFNGMGYQGDNISPHLAWDEVPAGTKSFVVTCYDPDAPTGSGWWHWIVANLPADTRVLPQGSGSDLVALPEGAIQTRTDFGKAGYGGAAPPKGETHRYIFTVHALDVERIEVDEGASGAMVGFNVHFGYALPGLDFVLVGPVSAAPPGKKITAPKVTAPPAALLPEAASPYQYPGQRSGHHRNA